MGLSHNDPLNAHLTSFSESAPTEPVSPHYPLAPSAMYGLKWPGELGGGNHLIQRFHSNRATEQQDKHTDKVQA